MKKKSDTWQARNKGTTNAFMSPWILQVLKHQCFGKCHLPNVLICSNVLPTDRQKVLDVLLNSRAVYSFLLWTDPAFSQEIDHHQQTSETRGSGKPSLLVLSKESGNGHRKNITNAKDAFYCADKARTKRINLSTGYEPVCANVFRVNTATYCLMP